MFNYLKPHVVGALLLLTLIVTGVKCSAQDGKSGEIQAWYDDSGKKVDAKYLGFKDGQVQLQAPDGRQFSVPLAKLSLSGQLRVKKIVTPRAFDAPPLPSSYAPPPAGDNPLPSDPSIEEFLDIYYSQLKAGKGEIQWHALPPSVKADVEAVVVRGAEVLGPKTFKQLQAILPNIMTIVRDKRSFIVGVPAIARQPEVAKMVNQILPALEPIIGVLTKPENWNSENFKPGKVGPWIMMLSNETEGASEKLLNSLKGILPPDKIPPNFKDATYKVLEKTADTAKVEFTSGKDKLKMDFKKVERCWITAETEQALTQLALAKAYLEGMDKAQIDQVQTLARTGLLSANSVLGALAKSTTQQEFNGFVEPLINQAMQAIQAQMGAGGGMAGGPGGMNPGGMSSPGGMAPPSGPRKGPMGAGMGIPQPTQAGSPQ